eukprot:758625-Hanusia_phi.AAC.1
MAGLPVRRAVRRSAPPGLGGRAGIRDRPTAAWAALPGASERARPAAGAAGGPGGPRSSDGCRRVAPSRTPRAAAGQTVCHLVTNAWWPVGTARPVTL